MGRLSAFVLGSAAGGGVPQWNCSCEVCRLAWAGNPRVKPRTQASIAVTTAAPADPRTPFVLINASPDLRQQILATPVLQPRGLRPNPIFSVLAPDLVTRNAIRAGEPFALPGGLEAELFLVPGKPPLYLEGDNPALAAETEANVGIELRAAGARLVFIPGAAKLTPAIAARLAEADAVLFDGTLFADDEMIAAGAGEKTGRRMGHMPVGGPDGTLAALKGLARRRILIHINNTNPILIEDSPQRRAVEAAGFEVAEDGMRIEL